MVSTMKTEWRRYLERYLGKQMSREGQICKSVIGVQGQQKRPETKERTRCGVTQEKLQILERRSA